MILRNAGPPTEPPPPPLLRVLHHDVDREPRVVGRREAGEGHREGAVVAAAVVPTRWAVPVLPATR